MASEVQCGGCRKRYRVDDRSAGKRVKCKNCGAAIAVPTPAASASAASAAPAVEDPFEALVAMEQSAAAQQASAPPPPRYAAPPPSVSPRSSPALGYAVPGRFSAPRAPGFQNAGAAELVEVWLPRALVVLFYAPVLVLQLIGAFRGPMPVVSLLSLAVFLALLVYVVLPIAAAGLRMAGGAMRFAVEPDPRFKIFAAYCPVPLAIVVACALLLGVTGLTSIGLRHFSLGAVLSAIGLGTLLGYSVSFFLMWLMFRLKFVEALVGWLLTSIFYFLGGLLAFAILFLLMLPVGFVMNAMGYKPHADQAAVNRAFDEDAGRQIASNTRVKPFMPAFNASPSWTPPPAPAVSSNNGTGAASVPPAQAQTFASDTPKPQPAPQAKPPAQNPHAGPSNVLDAPPVQQAPSLLDNAPGEPWKAVADVAAAKTKIAIDVRRVLPADSPRVYFPCQPSSCLAVVSNGFKSGIESWDLRPGGTRIGQIKGLKLEHPAVSPDGQLIAGINRGQAGEEPAYEVWSFKTGKMLKRLAGDEKIEGPDAAVGFPSNTRLVTVGKSLVIWDLSSGQAIGSTPLDKPFDDHSAATLSAGGKLLAIAGPERITLFDMATAQPLGWMPVPKLAAEQAVFGESWGCAGVSFSPDGTEVAAGLDSHNDRVRLLVWSVADASAKGDFLATLRKGEWIPFRQEDRSNGAQWLPDGSGWLVAGRAVLDRNTGSAVWQIADRIADGVHDTGIRRLLDKYHVLYTYDGGGKGLGVEAVTLPKAEMDKAAAIVKSGGDAIDASLPPLTSADTSGVKTVDETDAPWSVVPEPAARLPRPLTAGAIPIHGVKPPKGAFASIRGLYYTGPELEQVLVDETVERGGGPGQSIRQRHLTRVELPQGSSAGSITLPADARVLDVSPDGKVALLALSSDDRRLDAWSLDPAPGKPLAGFRPYRDQPADSAKVRWSAALDAGHVLTLNHRPAGQPARLVMWQLPQCKAVYQIDVPRDETPVLSQGRKLMELHGGIYDTATGALRGRIEAPDNTASAAAFEPGGTRLAIVYTAGGYVQRQTSVVSVWDLKTGKKADEFPVSDGGGPVQWVGPHAIMANDFYIDLQKRAAVWRYVRPWTETGRTVPPDGRVWHLEVPTAANTLATLVATALPSDEARKAADAIKPEELDLAKRGDGVSIDINLGGASGDVEALRTELKDRFTRKLRDAGYVVNDNQPTHLVINFTTRSTGRQVMIIGIGTQGGKTDEQEVVCTADFQRDSAQSLWHAEAHGGMFSGTFQVQKNQTAQQAYQADLYRRAVGLTEGFVIPSIVLRQRGDGTLPASRITAKGFEPWTPPPPPANTLQRGTGLRF